MRIRDVRTIPLEYPLPHPVFDANYRMATKPALLVEVETDEGLTGLGDAAHFGGPLRSTQVVIEGELRDHLAQAWNLPVAPHIHGSAVAVAADVHLLGAIPNASMAEMVFPAHPLMEELVREPLVVDRTGHVELSERAGLGIELDPRVVAKYRADR